MKPPFLAFFCQNPAFFFWIVEFGCVFFRTKTIKGSKLVHLVESYRNHEGQPRQRLIISLGDAQLPDPEQALIYQHLSIRWKAAFRPTKSYAN
jgi:hypothetical protein